MRLNTLLNGIKDMVDAIFIVDDGSYPPLSVPDMDTSTPIGIVRLEKNRGVGGAITAGYKEAHSQGMKYAVVLAGDGQMDPADLPAVLRPVVSGKAEYCKGERFTHPDAKTIPLTRLWGNYALTYLTSAISGYDKLLDAQCGFTAIDLDALFKRLPVSLIYPRYGFPNDLLILCSAVGFRVQQVQVRPVYDGQPSGLNPFGAIITYPVILARAILIKLAFRLRDIIFWRKGAHSDDNQLLPYW